jgi:electron transport complex protein RnfD
MDENLVVSVGPHIKDKATAKGIMWAVVFSLIPAGMAGVFIFGLNSLYIIVVSIISAALTEAAILAFRGREVSAALDGSAVLTGLLLAYNLPAGAPLWLPVAGSVFAIAIGKQVFGGLGHNIFNPALAGRAFLMVSWPVYMTTWQSPRWTPDAVSTATPLAAIKESARANTANLITLHPSPITDYLDLFLGNRGGCIGEVCVAALLIGAAFLFLRKIITWHIPAVYVATVTLLSWVFNGRAGLFSGDALFFIMAGGLVLGAFFMATDYVTSPLTARGKVIFGFGCGALTFIIRRFSGYPEGVSYSILIMNAAVPLIDKYTHPKRFGKK